jgi:hypothetical protein
VDAIDVGGRRRLREVGKTNSVVVRDWEEGYELREVGNDAGREVVKRVVWTDQLGVVYLPQLQQWNGRLIDRSNWQGDKNELAWCCGTRSINVSKCCIETR